MSSGVFVFDLIITLAIAGALLWSYGDWMKHRVAVTLSVLTAWYFSFLIIFILPLDVSSTAYRQCLQDQEEAINATKYQQSLMNDAHDEVASIPIESVAALKMVPCNKPYSLLDPEVLPDLWRVVYWSSQLLTWLILPLMQSYTQAGEFTAWGKTKSALWDNAIYYSSVLFIALVLLIYLALQPDVHLNWDKLKAIAAAASNTWGLFVLVLMLGYGLVEVPRTLWNRTQKGYQLSRAYFKVAKLMTERSDADEALDDALITVNVVAETIGLADMRRPWIETILSKIPMEMLEKVKRRRTNDDAFIGTDAPTERSLIKLHRQVIKALQTHHRVEAQWSDLTQKVFDLEDINRNMISNEHYFKRTVTRQIQGGIVTTFSNTVCNPTVEWYWKCLLSPLLLRAAASVAVVMSVLVIWSEVTFFVIHPPLSIFALLVQLTSSDYFTMELICFSAICYMSICAFFTIFKIRFLNYYYLASNHQSDEYTLLFSGALLCRLTPPLCLNFLSLIHMDSHVIESQFLETAYTRIMGHMDVVKIVSDYFNVYFPILLLLLTASTYFSVGARLLTTLGFQQFLDQESELPQVTLELVDEGKEHIKREKRRIQRLLESASRRQEFRSRFNTDPERADDAEYRGGDGSSNNIVRSGRGGQRSQYQIASPERSLIDNPGGVLSTSSPSSSTVRMEDLIEQQRRMQGNSSNENPLYGASYPNTSRNQRIADNEPPRNLFDDL